MPFLHYTSTYIDFHSTFLETKKIVYGKGRQLDLGPQKAC